MNKLPRVEEVEVREKSVLVRCDLEGDTESQRFKVAKQMVDYLRGRKVERIKIIGHSGNISMVEELEVDMNWDLRADSREETNDESLAKELAAGFDVYVNEAFATSHRKHCSIDRLPRFFSSQGKKVCLGIRFEKELEVLSRVLNTDGKKILVVGGIKVKDKNRYASELAEKFSKVLRGGLLEGSPLREDGLDITIEAVERYTSEISGADLIVAAGVMGKYEDPNSEYGTKEILTAIADSNAYKIAGGGDIGAAISKYGLDDKFDWISVGGGAMLEFLTTGILPGIEAITL